MHQWPDPYKKKKKKKVSLAPVYWYLINMMSCRYFRHKNNQEGGFQTLNLTSRDYAVVEIAYIKPD